MLKNETGLDPRELIDFYTKLAQQIYFEPCFTQFKTELKRKLLQYYNQVDFHYDVTHIKDIVDDLRKNPTFKENIYAIPLAFLNFSIQDGCYDARNMYLLSNILQTLKLNAIAFEKQEDELLSLINPKSTDEEAPFFKSSKFKKYCKIAGASIIGGTIIGLTGGLIAPILAASSGIIFGASGATLLGTTAGISIIGSIFGLTGATLTGYKMNKRSGTIKEFRFEPVNTIVGQKNLKTQYKSLAVTIAISGWITKECTFATPWRDLRITKEMYTLCWESDYLLEFGHGINYLVTWAAGTVAQEMLQTTILSAILSSISWPLTLISLASFIDNPWGVCFNRSEDVGKELANVLLSRVAGKRPVTLIGFSLGARVIYHALSYLVKFNKQQHLGTKAQRTSFHTSFKQTRATNRETNKIVKNSASAVELKSCDTSNNGSSIDSNDFKDIKGIEDACGIIEDVILLGAPIPAKDNALYGEWMEIISGTLTNCYCKTDWILKFLYRTSSAQYSIAGLEPINYQILVPSENAENSNATLMQHPRIINIDLTSVVSGHNDYVGKMPDIFKTLGYHAFFYTTSK